jgi:hypothetical protein
MQALFFTTASICFRSAALDARAKKRKKHAARLAHREQKAKGTCFHFHQRRCWQEAYLVSTHAAFAHIYNNSSWYLCERDRNVYWSNYITYIFFLLQTRVRVLKKLVATHHE